MEDVFERLSSFGVERDDLILAFDFIVQSEEGLSSQMLSMRDQAFEWLAQESARQTFTVTQVRENDCSRGGTWRVVEGTYEVPLFLDRDPVTDPNTPGFLNVGEGNQPLQNGFTNPPFTISIPCASMDEGGPVIRPIVLGHGLFGDGRGFVNQLAEAAAETDQLQYIAGATDWRGLSSPDFAGDLPTSFIGRVTLDLRNIRALPDRLRQGQLNTLVLARMMQMGTFNSDLAFRRPEGSGVFPGRDEEQFYFGASLGGIMGLMFSALSPDVVNSVVDVPAINFSILLERATPFLLFEAALELSGLSDAMEQALVLGIVHELWVRGESAGYATHITSDPFPGTNAKNILMAAALYDQQVSNTATEVAARTLNLPNIEGSVLNRLPQIENAEGPLSSALVFYDTGSFDPNKPAHADFIPPLTNLQAEPNQCDPHGLQALIPAALDQLSTFLQPGGQVVSFCSGLCDAAEPLELPFGNDLPCDPLE
jgi:pimeloyl-ACP methyl ester carboxylesterase